MSISDEIERLNKLRLEGALSEEEFAAAKRRLIGGSDERSVVQDDHSVGRAANRYVSWWMVMSVIGLILFAIVFFTVFLPEFNRAGDGPGGDLPPDIQKKVGPIIPSQ